MSQAEFKVVDIGARGGPMVQLSILSPFVHYFACEPDPVKSQRLLTSMNNSSFWKEVTVFSEALSFEQFDFALEIAASALSALNVSNVWSETITDEIESLALPRMRNKKDVKISTTPPKPEKFLYTDRERI